MARQPHALRVQVGWTWDVEFAGYIAALEWGYYERAGLSVALVEGGPTVSPEKALLDDAADIAVTVPDSTVAAIAGGADLAIVGVQYRRDPLSLVSDSGSGIAAPSDLSGRTICAVPLSCRATWFADVARSTDAETRHNDAQRVYMVEGDEALLLDAKGAAALHGLANRYGVALRDVLGPAAARRVA